MRRFYNLPGILSLSDEEKELIRQQALEGDPVACYKLAEIHLHLHECEDYVASAPELLQKAVNRVHQRFPLIFAGFRPGFFKYTQVQSDSPPKVHPDPGCLITMTREEIAACAYRVYYRDNLIIIEGFHAVSDGYGIAASFSTLAAEYFRDVDKGLEIAVPKNYFPNDDATKEPIVSWRSYANLLYSNWLNYYVYQTTPYDFIHTEHIYKDEK